MRISLLVLPSVVALMLSATVADNRPAVTHTIEDGFEHPNTHVEGFVLSDVFLHHKNARGSRVVQRRLTATRNHRRRAPNDTASEIEAIDASRTLNRAKVRGLAKLNFINSAHDREASRYSQAHPSTIYPSVHSSIDQSSHPFIHLRTRASISGECRSSWLKRKATAISSTTGA